MKRPIEILVIEDNKQLAGLLVEVLQQAGIKTLEAHSMTEAGVYASRRSVFGILADLSLGDGVGMDVIHLMKTILPLAPIIVMTGGDDDIIKEAYKAGAIKVIKKGSPEAMPAQLVQSVQETMRLVEERRKCETAFARSANVERALERIAQGDLEKKAVSAGVPEVIDKVLARGTNSGIINPPVPATETVEAAPHKAETQEAK